MQKDKIFFGERGLTSTSANHVADLAKEFYRNVEDSISEISLYTTKLSFIGGEKSIISEGKDIEFVESIKDKIQYIAQAKSLIAWLREAIKAKESLRKEIETMDLSDWKEELPTYPERDPYLTEDEYYGSLNVKERNRYYYLETLCSVYGKQIHEKGTLNVAKKDLSKKISNPRTIDKNGRDTLIFEYVPSVLLEEVDEVFFNLQSSYREYQAELNSIKHKCELAIQESIAKVDSKFEKELADYRNEMKVIQANFQKWKNEKLDEIRSLKIIIPDSLKVIYDQINSLGKK